MLRISNFCSVCTVNRLGYAITLNKSLRKANHREPHYVLIIDAQKNGKSFLNKTDFIPVYLEELNIKEIKELIKRYNAFELCNVLKPFFFEWLLKNKKIDILTYLDTDIFIYSKFNEIYKYLDSNLNVDLVITPHIHYSNKCLQNTSYNEEKLYSLAGLYNGGFYVLRRSKNIYRFLKWHKCKLIKYGYNAVEQSMFVDQKILDFAPILFDFVGIYKNVAYNVSHWSLHSHKLTIKDNHYLINNHKIVFFHFSQLNYNQDNIDESKLFNIPLVSDLVLQKMVKEYWNNLISNKYEFFIKKPYKYIKLYKEPELSFIGPLAYSNSQIDQARSRLKQTKEQLKKIESSLIKITKEKKFYLSKLNKIYNSKGWKYLTYLYKLRDKIFQK